ncbi:MAG: EAL domain-containing protein [Pseudomonadota bacterium]
MIDAAVLRACFDALPYVVFVKNSKFQIIYGNAEFRDLIDGAEFYGKTDADFFDEKIATAYRKEDEQVLRGKPVYCDEHLGDEVAAIVSKLPVTFPNGEPGIVSIGLDLGRKKYNNKKYWELRSDRDLATSEERLKSLEAQLLNTVHQKQDAIAMAMTDPATGLRNRNGLEADLIAAQRHFDATGKQFALAFTDLDHFKKINDRLGHDVGDAVLRGLSQRFLKLDGLRSAARMGGDEFALLFDVDETLDEDQFQTLMNRVQSMLSLPMIIDRKTIHATGSAGIAVYPQHGCDLSELKKNADAALLTAKADGRSRVQIFCNAIRDRSKRRRLLEDGLQSAIKERSLDIAFQPIVCSQTKQVLSVEVLARWQHPELGAIAPDEFIQIAADCGLLSKLDRVIFDIACGQLSPLLAAGRIQQFSVNVSPTDLTDVGFANDLLGRIEGHGLTPKNVCIEIVETASIHDLKAAKFNLDILHDAGICIALDDFGTGFSNLRSLLDLPLDRIKIDRSLVRDMETNRAVFDLFLTIVQLAGILEVSMVAEGLETDFNALMIASAGVTHLQGYYFAKPMCMDDLVVWLTNNEAIAPKAEDAA